MFDLSDFTLEDMTECSSSIRILGKDSQNMEHVSGKIIRFLNENLVDKSTGEHACALIRFFKTQSYCELDKELQEIIRNILGGSPDSPSMKCLILFSTLGDEPGWNSREKSSNHKAIPLDSKETVDHIPMISQLMYQFGLNVDTLLMTDPEIILEENQKNFNVFYISEAEGSPYIPDQKLFIRKYGIKSVLGFGGMLPSGDFFSIIMFSKIRISRNTAELFKTLALSVKVALLPFDEGPFFNSIKQST